MQEYLLKLLVDMLLDRLTPSAMQKIVDMTLDYIEDYVESTENRVDDAIILPLCEMIRATFNVED